VRELSAAQERIGEREQSRRSGRQLCTRSKPSAWDGLLESLRTRFGWKGAAL
jgi:hypothetical protein